jgi:hypothetical protein
VSSEPQRKRTRVHYNNINNNNNNNNHQSRQQFLHDNDSSSVVVILPSMEAMLAAPPEIIYRSVGPKHNPRALLTAAEAECLLKVALSAQELDVLLQLAEDSLHQQRFCRTYKQRLQQKSSSKHHPLLYPIISIVHFMEKQAKPELQHIQHRLSELLSELSVSASILRQSAEQNWTLADSLVHAFDTVESLSEQSLVQDKRSLAELEEELAQRIERIVALPSQESASQKIAVQRGGRVGTGDDGDGACRMLFPDGKYEDTSKKKKKKYSRCGSAQSMADLGFHLFRIQKKSGEADETKTSTVEGEGSGFEEPTTRNERSTLATTVIGNQGTMVGENEFRPACTQPNGDGDDDLRTTCYMDREESGTLSDTVLRNLQDNCSQGSVVKQPNATEALAVLALGGP